jgi:hypothetical protein
LFPSQTFLTYRTQPASPSTSFAYLGQDKITDRTDQQTE